ncbi:hypothetical protein AYI68_g4798 [Smittium mucronatum]|uniref:Uncharacterized protein n=1 Tax=Smittium mucronatum TaxID=133383 RepID=A0A1R0GW34_9FUNG|nr:hypothetical protein AYI68_g4798 [Smittium mucronatum]
MGSEYSFKRIWNPLKEPRISEFLLAWIKKKDEPGVHQRSEGRSSILIRLKSNPEIQSRDQGFYSQFFMILKNSGGL